MAEITAAAVKALREMTDLPMMDCKKALVEAGGDQQRAIEILREQNAKVMIKRAENPTSEGQIFIQIADDASAAAMVEVQCESSPVALGADLTKFGGELAAHLLAHPGAATSEKLLAQSAPSGKTFQQEFDELVGKIREKIVVARAVRLDGPVAGYVHHDKKTAVLFQATGQGDSTAILRDVAMHIAALKPVCVNPEDLDAALVAKERERLAAEARQTGKPENIIEKIVDGRMSVFYQEQGVLNQQKFAKDDSKTVSQALAEHGYKAKAFTRWVIGN